MTGLLARITTRDILAVITVASALAFNGISLVTGRDPDAATMTLAGAVVGYYFNKNGTGERQPETPLDEPSLPDAPK